MSAVAGGAECEEDPEQRESLFSLKDNFVYPNLLCVSVPSVIPNLLTLQTMIWTKERKEGLLIITALCFKAQPGFHTLTAPTDDCA